LGPSGLTSDPVCTADRSVGILILRENVSHTEAGATCPHSDIQTLRPDALAGSPRRDLRITPDGRGMYKPVVSHPPCDGRTRPEVRDIRSHDRVNGPFRETRESGAVPPVPDRAAARGRPAIATSTTTPLLAVPAVMSDISADGTSRSDAAARERRARNVNEIERGASALVGGALVLVGLKRQSRLGWAAALAGGVLVLRGLRGHSPVYEALDVDTTGRDSGDPGMPTDPTEVERSVTVDQSADDLDELWRDPEQLGKVFSDSFDIRAAGEGRQRWTAQAPLGRELTWEMRLVDDEPGERLRWKSPPDATVPMELSVHFRDAAGGEGTEMSLRASLDPPGGAVGTAAVERLDIFPTAWVGRALGRFKSLAETGEIPMTDENTSVRGKDDLT